MKLQDFNRFSFHAVFQVFRFFKNHFRMTNINAVYTTSPNENGIQPINIRSVFDIVR